jgi:hypothetical protein
MCSNNVPVTGPSVKVHRTVCPRSESMFRPPAAGQATNDVKIGVDAFASRGTRGHAFCGNRSTIVASHSPAVMKGVSLWRAAQDERPFGAHDDHLSERPPGGLIEPGELLREASSIGSRLARSGGAIYRRNR